MITEWYINNIDRIALGIYCINLFTVAILNKAFGKWEWALVLFFVPFSLYNIINHV